MHRLPPHDIEAEESLLAALLLVCEQIDDVFSILKPADFYRTKHAKIFEAIKKLHINKETIDLVPVKNKLQEIGALEEVGGFTFLVKLTDYTPIAVDAVYTAEIIKNKSILREIISSCNDITKRCFDQADETRNILDEAQKNIISIQPVGGVDRSVLIDDLAQETLDYLDRIAAGKSGLHTGWRSIDKFMSGLQSSDYITIAARPGMGKTAFACNLIDSVVMADHAAVFFSLEMSRVQIINRILPRHTAINGAKFRLGGMNPDEWKRVQSAIEKIRKTKLIVNDEADLSYHDIRRLSRKYKKEHDIKLVIIDYLQLLKGDTDKNSNRVSEISSITRNLKNMAKELDIPVVALAQLNRAVENRNDKRPQLSDLRESGSIEQDSDIVVFIYRDEVYNPDPNNPEKGIAEIIFRKYRNGNPGTVRMFWNKQLTSFFDLERE